MYEGARVTASDLGIYWCMWKVKYKSQMLLKFRYYQMGPPSCCRLILLYISLKIHINLCSPEGRKWLLVEKVTATFVLVLV